MTDSNAKIIEPLAKFHAKVHSQYRVTFPRETREAFNIQEKDYVVLIVRKIEGHPPIPTKRALVVLKVSTNGVMVLPVELVKRFGISKGEIIEILFLRHIHPPKIVIPEVPVQITGELAKRGYILLSEDQEISILRSAGTSHSPEM